MSIEARREIGELLAEQPLGDEIAHSVDALLHAATDNPDERCLAGAVVNLADGDFDEIGNVYNDDVRAIIRLVYRARGQREQARNIAVQLEGECAVLEQERDAALLRAERAEKGCYRCGGAA